VAEEVGPPSPSPIVILPTRSCARHDPAESEFGASVAGLICGSIAAVMLANAMKSLLYGVVATDAWSLGSAAATLLGGTAATARAAASRAMRVNPVEVLRAE
jgi:hypothetical protein